MIKARNKKQEAEKPTYDGIPYQGYSFEFVRPEHLRNIGFLFGMSPPSLEKARVLELGCNDGISLFRFAETYPKSYTLGIDLSQEGINHGHEIINQLKLKNIELKNMSITDLDESHGKFDYIICHGLFSWVSDSVKDSILNVSKKLLNKNGLVFISYNTLPGCNMTNTVRELMMFHSSNFSNIGEKIQQSRAALNFLQESLEGQKTPHAEFMQESAKRMALSEDHYLKQEYLSKENKAYYLHEFVDIARSNGFEYLGDSDVQKMYVGNLPPKAAEKLGTISDIVRAEQYIDFIKNTQNRCTILCHKDTTISRNINAELLSKFNYYSNIALDKSKSNINLVDDSNVTFYLDGIEEKTISSTSPEIKVIFIALAKNLGNPLSIKEIINESKKLVPSLTEKKLEESIHSNFVQLILSGSVKFILDKPKSIYSISNKPKISNLALLQIQQVRPNNQFWITNNMNQPMDIQAHQVNIIKSLDGKHTVDEIKANTLNSLIKGEINAQEGDKKIDDKNKLKVVADTLVDSTLESMRLNFNLIA